MAMPRRMGSAEKCLWLYGKAKPELLTSIEG